MPGLLVSVRTPWEARCALAGGADWIDVKEPARGPLGAASPDVWRAVRAVVPAGVPFSTALGELPECMSRAPSPEDANGLDFLKVGLAGVGPDWPRTWARLRESVPGVRWVAVAYLDW